MKKRSRFKSVSRIILVQGIFVMGSKIEEKIAEKLRKIKVKDIMTRAVLTVREDRGLSDLADLLIRTKVSGVPVLDEAGAMTGIITTTDLLKLMGKIKEGSFGQADRPLNKDLAVESVMTKDVSTIAEGDTLLDVVNIMCAKGIHTLPVIKDGKLAGIVGRRDVIMYFYSAVRDSIEESNR